MPRRRTFSEKQREMRALRAAALARPELRVPAAPRVSATGVTSAPLKVTDEETRRLVDEALARRRAE